MMPTIETGDCGEIVPARPRAQVAARVTALLLAVVGLGLLAHLQMIPWIRRYLAGASRFEIAERTQNVLFVLAAMLLFGGGLAMWQGIRVFRAGRWPLEGAFVMKDTRIRRGAAAHWRAATLIAVGILQIGLAIYAVALPQFIYQESPQF